MKSPFCFDFSCLESNCTHCCCAEFNGISPHLSSIENRSFSSIILTSDDYKEIVNAGFSELTQTRDNGEHTLKTKEDGTCFALVDGCCSIYNVRPTVCRAYPLYIDVFAGLCLQTDCDGVRKTLESSRDWSCEIESVIKMYKHWIDYYERMLDEGGK